MGPSEPWIESTESNGRVLYPIMWEGSYKKFWKKLVGGAGIFCLNFCTRRGQFYPCQMMWCGGCYKEHGNDTFPKTGKKYG